MRAARLVGRSTGRRSHEASGNLATQGGLTAVRYILLTPRGLEGIACREVKEVEAAATILDQGRGAVLVEAEGDPQPLMELHSIDDLYAEVLLLDDLDPRRNPLALL